MENTPDLLEALPALRQVIIVERTKVRLRPVDAQEMLEDPSAVVEYEPFTSYDIVSPLRPKDRWRAGEVRRATCQPQAHYWLGKDGQAHAASATPAWRCTCGFYGWLPWAEGRWPRATPLSAEGDPRLRIVELRPHPLIVEYTSFLLGGPGNAERWCRIHLGADATRCTMMLVVLNVGGKVIPTESGVRAERATITAAVDPTTIPVPPWDLWNELLMNSLLAPAPFNGGDPLQWVERTMREQCAELIGRAWSGPIISWEEAVKRSTDAWAPLRHRWDGVSHIAG